MQVRICPEPLVWIGEITRAAQTLRAEIPTLIRPLAPGLLEVSGVGDLSAARLLVETTGGDRFATDSQPARQGGCAPIEVSSGRVRRHRLSRMGNWPDPLKSVRPV